MGCSNVKPSTLDTCLKDYTGARGARDGGGRTSLIGLNKVWYLGTGYEVSYTTS